MCNKVFDAQPDNSIAIEVPDGYLVAELSGAPGEYPGIHISFFTEDGWLTDLALVESEDASAATEDASDKYIARIWDFGKECSRNRNDLEFTSGDVARHIEFLQALEAANGTEAA